MPDGWTYSILLGDGRVAPVEDGVCVLQGNKPVLAGEVAFAVAMAACVGELHYFADERLHGFPVVVNKPYGGGNVKFWWLFADCDEPAAGHSRNLYWVAARRYTAAMSVAEYTEMVMMHLFEMQVEEHPKTKDWDYEEVLEWMLDTFRDSPMDNTKTSMDVFNHEDDDAPAYVIGFLDGSFVRLDMDGWTAFEKPQRLVPDLDKRPAKGKRSALRAVRMVNVLVTEDGRGRYH